MSVNILQEDGLHRIAGNGGNTEEIEQKLQELEALIEQTKQLRADLESYGMVKLSNATNVTDSTGLALPVTEKNPDISGTLANKIANYFLIKDRRVEENNEFDLNTEINPRMSSRLFSKSVKNSPDFIGNYFYLIIIVYSKKTEENKFTGKQIAIGYVTEEIFSRSCFNDVWSEWKKISAV